MGAKKELESLDEEYLSTTKIAKRISRSSETVRREIAAGRLRAFRLNGDYMIKKEDYEEWKAKRFQPVE